MLKEYNIDLRQCNQTSTVALSCTTKIIAAHRAATIEIWQLKRLVKFFLFHNFKIETCIGRAENDQEL